MVRRQRLDVELVRRGLIPSRERAQAEVEAGRVLVGGAPALRSARLVAPSEPLRLMGAPPRFVSRGGEKLDAGLTRFDVAVDGRLTLDAGASTGGFTDCLLQRGAREVIAVDVGYGQLDLRLRGDSRVRVLERTNVRHLSAHDIGGACVDLIVADLAFISLRTVASALVDLAVPAGDLVVLVKPQFEVGRQAASRTRGVIVDPSLWRMAVEGVIDAFGGHGAAIMGVMSSPLRGADGNVEFLIHVRTPKLGVARPPTSPAVVESWLADAVADAVAEGERRIADQGAPT